uniref:rRNA adenine N(6)-methyltransferase n=1 Tax=Chrysotila carterae TaxID=13221 RepID=A0A7S4EUJ1_CHRCT
MGRMFLNSPTEINSPQRNGAVLKHPLHRSSLPPESSFNTRRLLDTSSSRKSPWRISRYQISSPLVFKLLAHKPRFRCAVLMVQREFALRLCAKAGDELYCRLSVNTQLLSKVDHLMKVSKNSFRPPPKVDSSVVRLEPMHPPPPVNFIEWDGLVRLCFNRKNKTLSAIFRQKPVLQLMSDNLKTHLAMAGGMNDNPAEEAMPEVPDVKEIVNSVLEDSGYGEQRSTKLELDDFMALLAKFNERGLHFSG